MATYIILSRFSPRAFDDPKHFVRLAEQVSKKIKRECPKVEWKGSYATLGRFNVIDIVEAADPKQIEKVAMIIRPLDIRRRRPCWPHPGKSSLMHCEAIIYFGILTKEAWFWLLVLATRLNVLRMASIFFSCHPWVSDQNIPFLHGRVLPRRKQAYFASGFSVTLENG